MRHDFTNALVLCGHAIYVNGDPRQDAAWILEDYQVGHGEVFYEHVRQFCLELQRRGPATLGIITGGQSRSHHACYLPESVSYHRVAIEADYFGCHVADQITTEWSAVDSFTNIAFSLARFVEVTGRLPQQTTVISLQMKEGRIRQHFDVCRSVLTAGHPMEFEFVGVGNPPPHLLPTALASEARTRAAWAVDPFGVQLAAKQATRNPWRRSHPYAGLALMQLLFDAMTAAGVRL